jgi:hypothetical protein
MRITICFERAGLRTMQVITDRDNERHITTKLDLFARLSLSAGALLSAFV